MERLISSLLAPALFLGAVAPAARAAAPVRVVPRTVGTAPIAGVVPAPVRGPGAQYLPDFKLTPAGVNRAYRAASAALKLKLDEIAALKPEEVAFENTVLALETAEAEYGEAMYPPSFLGAVSPNARLRKSVDKMEKVESEFLIAQESREDVYAAVKAFADSGKAVELEGENKRVFEKTMLGFKKRGMGLAPAERETFMALAKRTDDLVRRYNINLRDWDDGFDVRREELEGVPERVINGLQKGKGGKLRVSVRSDIAGAVIGKADSARLRRKTWFMVQRKAAKKNIPILTEVLQLRQEQAWLLGYKSFAEMQIDGRMAKNPQRVSAFLNRLKKLLRKTADKEEARVLARKQKDQPGAAKTFPWDAGYYGIKLFKETLSIEPEKVREYFPYEHVLPETLKIYGELLGVEFREVKGAALWHRQVRAYDVHDAGTGVRLARINLDLFTRQGKRGGAAAYPLVKGRELADGSYREPVVNVVASFAQREPGRPALLSHGDVETLFHELGHAVHTALTTAQRPTLSGTSVSRDFVETMSQMMENFTWRPEQIGRLSKHYKTGEGLPEDMLGSLLASRNYHSASDALGQAAMAAMDLAYYTRAPLDVLAMFRKIMKDFTGRAIHPSSKFPARFAHILGGYAAGYYGYLWSRVTGQDIYSVFEAAPDGPLSRTVGARYREVFLKKGAILDENRSLADFLQRRPSEAAFLKWLGIAK